jgi:uncharacterized protein involved in tellurium resistance
MAGDITVNGRKKLATLQKEFSEAFNYLFIAFIDVADKEKSGSLSQMDCSKSISEVRSKISNEELSLNGRTLIKNVEKYFDKELGIYCQIGVHNYGGKNLYIPTDDAFNNMGLTAANKWAQDNGCSAITKNLNLSDVLIVGEAVMQKVEVEANVKTEGTKVIFTGKNAPKIVKNWSLDNNQVMIVAGSRGYKMAQKYSLYRCQNERSFRSSKYLAFYDEGRIEEIFEILEAPMDNCTPENTALLKNSQAEYPINDSVRFFKLKSLGKVGPIENDSVGKNGKSVPFTYGQARYTTYELIGKAQKTSELIYGIKEETIVLEEKGQNTIINPNSATIKLQWSTLEDFDIAVLFKTKNDRLDMVYFASKGNLETYPFIRLDKDERGGEGKKTETILINHLEEIETLAIIAWDYSNSGSKANFDKSDVQVTIVDTDDFETTAKLNVTEKSDSVCVASIENKEDGYVFTNISKNFMRKTDKTVMWESIFAE